MPEGGFVLIWRNHELSRERLGYKETVRQLRHRLERCHPSNIPHAQEELTVAEKNEGPTVFDWLIEIIHEHCPGGQEAEDNIMLVLE